MFPLCGHGAVKDYSRPCLPPLWPRLYAEPFGLGEKKGRFGERTFRVHVAVIFSNLDKKKKIAKMKSVPKSHKSPLILPKNDRLYGYLVLILATA